ncbi:MAG: type II toxin-antitoxin system prevent-host-death family antitoxin [Thermodesulfobacteriota bacterium]
MMEGRISATELARKLGDILGRVRYRREAFVVERNGEPIARLAPISSSGRATVAEALRAWKEDGAGDESFADDLERIGAADRPARNPWA